MNKQNRVALGLGVLCFILLGAVLFEFVIPMIPPFEDSPAARLDCDERENVTSGPEPMDFRELSPEKQDLVERAIEGEEKYPGLTESQAEFFEHHWKIMYKNSTYICVPTVS